ncbi:MAG: hypothetical protein QG657_5791, partial [Acidobacteriota bacterium]|nr:hypothetical protein [Acidobacteriota bacterium]
PKIRIWLTRGSCPLGRRINGAERFHCIGIIAGNGFSAQGNDISFFIFGVGVKCKGAVALGAKTITCDNANAVKPFGAIDTPAQGATASGKPYPNFGWALTPMPNMIPIDGSTITVWVDGMPLGHPVYNIYREDIPTKFPGYANSNGAVGYYYLDTTKYANGVHTIAWTVEDNAGNEDGIGSRYFSIQNTESGIRDQAAGEKNNSRRGEPPCSPVFDSYAPTCDPSLPAFGEAKTVEIKELERVELNLPDKGVYEGYLVVGDQLQELPIGSTLDRINDIFYWQPGAGFIGRYHFAFLEKGQKGLSNRKDIIINILPKFIK